MSQSVYPYAASAFVNRLLALDEDIACKIRNNSKNVNEIYQIYLERLSRFEKSCIVPLSELDKSLLQSIKEDLYLEFKLYNLKADVKSHIDSIQSGLHDVRKIHDPSKHFETLL